MGFLAGAVPSIVGGVAGAIFGGKDKKQTETTQANPLFGSYGKNFLDMAKGYAGAGAPAYGGPLTVGMSPWVNGAAGIFGGAAGLAGNAEKVLSGDPAAISAAMNPYESDVIGGLNKQYDLERNATQQQIADQATRAGAFGGDRYGVALGQALADTNRAQAQQVGGLQYQGYNDVLNRAAQNLGFGFNAASGLAGLGQYATGVNQANNANLYNAWLQQQQNQMQRLGLFGNAVSSMAPLAGGSSTLSTPGSGVLGGAIGGAMAGQGLWNMIGGGGGSGGPPLASTPMSVFSPDPVSMLPNNTMQWLQPKLPGQP